MTRRTAGDGSIYQRKSDKRWVAAITIASDDGRQRRMVVTAKDRGQVIAKRDQLRQDIDDGVIISKTMKVDAWLDYWLKSVRGPSVRPNTIKFYDNAIRNHLLTALGRKRLSALTPGQVRNALESIDSTASRRNAHTVLSLALKSAMVEGLIRRNVLEAVAKPRHVAKVRGSFDAATAQHIILTAYDTRTHASATRWAAAFLTGARQGELLGLRWAQVDLEDGFIELAWQLQKLDHEHGCQNVQNGQNPPCGRQRPSYCPEARWSVPDGFEFEPLRGSLALTRPKSRAGYRLVPLIAPLWAAMRQLRATSPDNDYGLVWVNPAGNPIGPKADHKAWHELLQAARVPATPLHAARHTTATLLQEAGVDEDTRMRITGHSSATAHRGYVHVSQDRTRVALESLSALMPGER